MNLKTFCQEIKNATIQEPITEGMERENNRIPESSGQKQKELAFQVNEMQVQKLDKGIFIGDCWDKIIRTRLTSRRGSRRRPETTTRPTISH